MRGGSRVRAAILLVCATAVAAGQEKPITRAFVVGGTYRYRVQLVVRTELEGHQPQKQGAQAYVVPFAHFAEGKLSWRASRRVVALQADGSAEVEEVLDEFSGVGVESGPRESDEVQRLAAALRLTLAKWAEPRTLQYRETPAGLLVGLSALGVPPLDEAVPQLLTPWLLRALRPVAAVPARAVRPGQRWTEPRTVPLAQWSDVRATESGEWLDAPESAEPAVRLHVVQQISGRVASGPDRPAGGEAEGRFHGESLSSVALADGRMLLAARAATREITWVLSRVEGLPEPPRFRGRLSAQVRLEEIE